MQGQRDSAPPPALAPANAAHYTAVASPLQPQSQAEKGQLTSQQLAMMQQHGIGERFCRYLSHLSDFNVAFLCDDSGSMRLAATSAQVAAGANTALGELKTDLAAETRWDRLKRMVRIAVELASTFDDDGVDLYFLFRRGRRNVRDPSVIDDCFKRPPDGDCTPLTGGVDRVVAQHRNDSKPLLLVIATDGMPTREDNRGDAKTVGFALKQTRWLNLLSNRNSLQGSKVATHSASTFPFWRAATMCPKSATSTRSMVGGTAATAAQIVPLQAFRT